jgi:predicted transposase YbfD/YdcC
MDDVACRGARQSASAENAYAWACLIFRWKEGKIAGDRVLGYAQKEDRRRGGNHDAERCWLTPAVHPPQKKRGEMPALLDELKAAFGKTRLFSVVTTDAGNTSCGIAGKAVALGLDYFMQIKSTHGDLHSLAEENLKHRRPGRAHASDTDTQNGQVVTYHLWRDDLTAQGWLDWTHARQLVRIRRTTECQRTGNVTVGNRYYVTSLLPDVLSAASALTTCRAHWRCENNTHWTADAELMEDRRRPAWSRHPQGSLVVSVLRMMALSILAVARKLSRLGYSAETPSWGQVAEHFLLELCGSILETKAFDTV